MTPREAAAVNASIRHAADMALVAGATIGARDDACSRHEFAPDPDWHRRPGSLLRSKAY